MRDAQKDYTHIRYVRVIADRVYASTKARKMLAFARKTYMSPGTSRRWLRISCIFSPSVSHRLGLWIHVTSLSLAIGDGGIS